MNKILAALVLIISPNGVRINFGYTSEVGMRPGETAFEHLFNQGIGQPWVEGNPPAFQGEDYWIAMGTS